MPPLKPAQWDEVRRRAGTGESAASIAKTFGVNRRTVEKRLKPAKSGRTAPAAKRAGKAKPAKKTVSKPASPQTAPAKRAKAAGSQTPALAVRRQLLNRLYRAIDTKLKLMERRMNSEIHALEASGPGAPEDKVGLSPADHERETRAFGALVKTINSVRDMQAELDLIANGHPNTAADARLNADADRYRREIAERLARFVPPGT